MRWLLGDGPLWTGRGVLNPPRGAPAPPVDPIAPTITAQPTISGSNVPGSTLALDLGTASGTPTPVASIEWLRAGVVIVGETSTSYVTSSVDGSMPISARVVWANSAGSTAPATTNTIVMGAAQPSQNVDVEYPGLISTFSAPAPAVQFATPDGWSSTDPSWDAVAYFADFPRFFGADQSETGIPYEFTSAGSAKLPTVTADSMVFDGSQRYVTDGSPMLGSGAGDVTIEAVGLLPAAAGPLIECYNRATPTVINWSIGWQADPAGWVITVWNGGAPLTFVVADTAPTAPVTLCLKKGSGTLRFLRNGVSLDSRAAGAFVAGDLSSNRMALAVGGGASVNTAMTIRQLRITNGVARYGTSYTPGVIPLTAPKSTGGAHRIGFGYWTQTSKDSVIGVGGKALLGVTSRIGAGIVYDPATKRSQARAVALWDVRDAHNQPTFLRRADGRIITFATGHTFDRFFRGISAAADDWLSTQSFEDITAQLAPATRFTYMKSFQLEGLPGEPIYLSTRIGNNNSTYREMMMKSVDGGQTFSRWNYLDTSDARRMYPIAEKTSPTRADWMTTAGNMGDTGGNEGIYHFSFDAEVIRDSQGNEIALPIVVPEDATSLYGKWVEGLESNLKAIRKFGSLLVLCYTIRPDSGRKVLMRATYDLSNPGPWSQEYVGDTANAFAFHPTSPDNIFLTVPVAGKGVQVAEFVRVGKGDWRIARIVTDIPTGRGVEPFDMISCAAPDVLFIACGRQSSYLDYMAALVAVDLGGASTAPVVAQAPQLPAQVQPGQAVTLTNLGRASGYPTPAPHVSWTLDGQVISTGLSATIPMDAGGKALALTVNWINGAGQASASATRTVSATASLLYLDAAPVLRTQMTVEQSAPDSISLRTDANATRSVIAWAAAIPVGSVISFNWSVSNSARQWHFSLSPTADADPKEAVVSTTGASGSVSYTVTQAGQQFLNLVVGSGRNDLITITNFKVTAP